MKIQIVSDLHLSLAPFDLPNVGADILILAGDIHRPIEAISWAKTLGLPCIFVPGNHEYYGSNLTATDRLLREQCHNSNVTLLNCDVTQIGRVRIVGATLWTNFLLNGPGLEQEKSMRQAQQFSRDFTRIYTDEQKLETFTPTHCETIFNQHVAWLEDQLAQPFDGETVVITHYAPSDQSVAPRFAGSILNACFVSNLDDLVEKSGAAIWVHGHAHDSFDYVIGNTRVVANPRGYVKDGKIENAEFNPSFTVDLNA
jgi:Icc-related predicted phosphoesterase